MNVELEAMYARMADRAKPKPEAMPAMPELVERRLAMMRGWMRVGHLMALWGPTKDGVYGYLCRLHSHGRVERRVRNQRCVEWKRKEEKPQ